MQIDRLVVVPKQWVVYDLLGNLRVARLRRYEPTEGCWAAWALIPDGDSVLVKITPSQMLAVVPSPLVDES